MTDDLSPEETAIATCEACGKHIQEGEPYLWGPETNLCGECAPTYKALIDELEGFVNADGEQLTAEQCRAWYEEHIAAGGKPTDSMATVDRSPVSLPDPRVEVFKSRAVGHSTLVQDLSPRPKTVNWQDEYAALSEDQRVMLQQVADHFGVPLIAAFYRAKELGQLAPAPPQSKPQSRDEGIQPVIIVWDENGKLFQNWTADFKNGDGIEHGKRIAKQIGGSYEVLPKPRAPSLDINEICFSLVRLAGTQATEEAVAGLIEAEAIIRRVTGVRPSAIRATPVTAVTRPALRIGARLHARFRGHARVCSVRLIGETTSRIETLDGPLLSAWVNNSLLSQQIEEYSAHENPARQSQMRGWQDISTAPVGKSVIICTWWKHSPTSAFRAEGYLDRDTKTWRNQDGGLISEDRTQPTHWQPIPEAPTADDGEPVPNEALRILMEGIDGAESDMASDADTGERVDLFDYEISLPYETAREIAAILRAVPPQTTPPVRLMGYEEAIEAAKMARTRLMTYANGVQRGEIQGGGREFERRIWGAFSDFDQACDALATTEGQS